MRELFETSGGEPLFDADIQDLKKEQDTERKRHLAQWELDFQAALCETPAGRRVLWWLLNACGYFERFEVMNAAAYGYLAKRAIGQDIVDVIGAERVLQTLIRTKRENRTEYER